MFGQRMVPGAPAIAGAVLLLGAAAVAALALLLLAPPANAGSGVERNPVIFVHGFAGSGAQFESQKMRLTSNGYPEDHVTVLEYDSTFATESRQQVFARLDRLVAELKQRTGTAHVDILGHSLGTSVMQEYLNSSRERAANVAHYVNIDGREADSPPGGVPTLAIWAGRGEPGRKIDGARNVTIPNQTHVESATSAEAFVEFYEFFTGGPPSTDRIVPESGPITVEGRAVLFPQNKGLPAGVTVEIWPVDRATGQRASATPAARLAVDGTGAWGPAELEAGRSYEFALLRPGVATLHYYREPFLRSDHLVRLLYSNALEALVERGEAHVGALVLRYKELWGDQGAQNDILSFNGTHACNAATCPIDKRVNAVFAFDRRSDGRTDLSAPDPVFTQLPFITGVDIFMPAARPPTGTTSISLQSRGTGPTRTVNVPNFPSTTDGVVVQFDDFERTASSPGGSARKKQKLHVWARPRSVRTGRRRTIRLRVTKRTTGGRRAVAGANVTLAGRRVKTGGNGRATMTVRFRKPGMRMVRATRAGYRPGTAGVRVVRAGARPRFTG